MGWLTVAKNKQEKHEELRNVLRGELLSGRFRPGDLFYSQNEIASRFGLSHTTVLRALKGLCDEGRLTRVQGRGTFVSERRREPGRLSSLLVVGHHPERADRDVREAAVPLIFEEAARHKVSCQYVHTPVDTRGHAALPSLPAADGILAIGGEGGIPWLLAERTDAVVVVGPTDPGYSTRFDVVTRDYTGGPRQVLAHFHELGFRKIGILGGASYSITHYWRMEGVLAALREFRMETRPQWMVEARWDPEVAHRAALSMLGRKDRPRAIFAFGDSTATGALRAAYDLDLSVPDDVAVAGFDGLELSEHLTPPLTAYRTDLEELARKAYELVEYRIANSDAERRYEIVKGEVVVRQSTQQTPPEMRESQLTSVGVGDNRA